MNWKPISYKPPNEKVVLIRGTTGNTRNREFYVSGYYEGDGFNRWVTVDREPLSDSGWEPVEWTEIEDGKALDAALASKQASSAPRGCISLTCYQDSEWADYSLRTMVIPIASIFSVFERAGEVWTSTASIDTKRVTILRTAHLGVISDVASPTQFETVLHQLERLGWPLTEGK